MAEFNQQTIATVQQL